MMPRRLRERQQATMFLRVTTLLALGAAGLSAADDKLKWEALPDLPGGLGVAGPFAGAHNDALIIAGGANFPDGEPWRKTADGIIPAKVYYDTIHIVTRDGDGHSIIEAKARLPEALGYGVSISTTGGGQGIGRTVAEELARLGAHTVLADINLETAEKSAEAICKDGGSASATALNVADAENVQQVFDLVAKNIKPIDILVNNAGITKDGLMMRMKEADWDRVLSVNLKGSFLCGQQAAKQMMKQRQGAYSSGT